MVYVMHGSCVIHIQDLPMHVDSFVAFFSWGAAGGVDDSRMCFCVPLIVFQTFKIKIVHNCYITFIKGNLVDVF